MYRNHLPPYESTAYKEAFPAGAHEWANIATRRLASWEKARIKNEIEAHVEDAVAEAVADGMDEKAARKRAVDALGSPRAANKEYRKSRCPAEYEYSLMSFKRSMVLQEYSLIHKWLYRAYIHVWVVLMTVAAWVLTFIKPEFVFFALLATCACTFRFVCYQRWFPKWLEADQVRKTLIYKAVSSNLCWLAVAVFYLTYGWDYDWLLLYVIFSLIHNPMLFAWWVSLPKDLKWSEIEMAKRHTA
jgi:hypothetical protein